MQSKVDPYKRFVILIERPTQIINCNLKEEKKKKNLCMELMLFSLSGYTCGLVNSSLLI